MTAAPLTSSSGKAPWCNSFKVSQAERQSRPSSFRFLRTTGRNTLGMVKTTCRCDTGSSTSEAAHSVKAATRLAAQDGQN